MTGAHDSTSLVENTEKPQLEAGGINPDALNPACHVAGIRMIPVVNGKYKVWTKKMGSGTTKVLLLHGGPGFNHEYFGTYIWTLDCLTCCLFPSREICYRSIVLPENGLLLIPISRNQELTSKRRAECFEDFLPPAG